MMEKKGIPLDLNYNRATRFTEKWRLMVSVISLVMRVNNDPHALTRLHLNH